MTTEQFFAAELTRQRYQLQRQTILERLRKFIRKPESEEREPDYFVQPGGVLAPYLR